MTSASLQYGGAVYVHEGGAFETSKCIFSNNSGLVSCFVVVIFSYARVVQVYSRRLLPSTAWWRHLQ